MSQKLNQRTYIKMTALDKSMINHMPSYATSGSSGLDLRSSSDYILHKGKTLLISTGIALSLDIGYEGQIRSRSGLAFKHHVIVLNSPATIDSDYRGEIKVILFNGGDKDFMISKFDRIAQLVIAKYEICSVYTGELEISDVTGRGDKGFGSTGIQ